MISSSPEVETIISNLGCLPSFDGVTCPTGESYKSISLSFHDFFSNSVLPREMDTVNKMSAEPLTQKQTTIICFTCKNLRESVIGRADLVLKTLDYIFDI